MAPDKQIIAIAEACGWFKVRDGDDYNDELWTKDPQWHARPYTTVPRHEIPDYLNCLNAMHEAEELFLPFESAEWQDYAYWLAHLTPIGGQDHATAAQRAEAFLRTLNLWTDGP